MLLVVLLVQSRKEAAAAGMFPELLVPQLSRIAGRFIAMAACE